MPPNKYTKNLFDKLCSDYNIKLVDDYSNVKFNSNTKIKGKCDTNGCENNFEKRFSGLYENKIFKCVKCTNKECTKRQMKYNYDVLKKMCEDNNIRLVKDYSNEELKFDSKINLICINDDCNNEYIRAFHILLKQKLFICRKCSYKDRQIKTQKTNIDRYDVQFVGQNEQVKEKAKKTNINRYGTEYTFQSKIVRTKIEYSIQERYGVSNISKSDNIKKKKKDTMLERYNVENPSELEFVKEKRKNTNKERYGVEYASQSKIIKDRIKKTCIERYGVEHTSQNAEMSERNLRKAYNTKKYTLPSGKIITYQGYEHFALDELFEDNYKEDDILNSRVDVPTIWYNTDDGKKHRHYVDIYIKSQNKCIEVKSDYTIKCKPDIIFLKQKAAKELDMLYEIWVYDKNGKKVACHT